MRRSLAHTHEGYLTAISARIDGEDRPLDDATLDAHLEACPSCRHYQGLAVAQHRRVRVRPAGRVPDLSGRILAVLPPAPQRRPSAPGRRRRLTKGAGVLLGLVVALSAGWAAGADLGSRSPAPAASAFPGAVVLDASARAQKPDVVLTDTHGRPYPLARATEGRVTLLYFGNTHCLVICPLTMGLAADAISRLPRRMRRSVTVVFVTTDPGRDRPSVLARWLAGVTDGYPGIPSFVGLTGPQGRIHQAEREAGLPVTSAPIPAGVGGPNRYRVTGEGSTLAYGPDGVAALQIGDDEPLADYAVTLAHLIAGGAR